MASQKSFELAAIGPWSSRFIHVHDNEKLGQRFNPARQAKRMEKRHFGLTGKGLRRRRIALRRDHEIQLHNNDDLRY